LILHGDCLDLMAEMEPNSVDAIVCDPPYELSFMGKKWDGTGIAFDPATWEACLRVLKPGGHLVAFGGTRTSHRMVCAIEDAGFEIRDSLVWLYGSGSTGCAAALEGFDFIGCEREAEYVEIARARVAHWTPKNAPQLALTLELTGD
jgi:DNA modification methylase